MKIFRSTKKLLVLAISGTVLSFFGVSSLHAELALGTDAILAKIEANTANILDRVNTLPVVLGQLYTMATSWNETNDKSGYSGQFQGSFASLGSVFLKNVTSPATDETLNTFIQNFFSNINENSEPYANDLDVLTIFGKPLWGTDPRKKDNPNINPTLNFLTNVSGLTITHTMPNNSWRGNAPDISTYNQYLRTITSAQTFNGYLLSQVWKSLNMEQSMSASQQQLLKLATANDGQGDTTWFTTVGSESLGLVLRQILMFLSQSYVLQLQQLQTERQILAAQTVGNTIAIAGSIGGEGVLVARAIRAVPGA